MSAFLPFRLYKPLLSGVLALVLTGQPIRAADELPTESVPTESSPAPVENEEEGIQASVAQPSEIESSPEEPSVASEDLPQGDVSPAPSTPWVPNEDEKAAAPSRLSALSSGHPDVDEDLTLLELVDVALNRNPSTRQAWQTARTAVAQLGVARSAYYPTITLNLRGGPSHTTSPTFPGTSESDQWSGGPQLGITYLLLDFGGRDAGAEAARQALFSSNFQFNQKVQDVILGVMQAYYDLDSKHALLDNAATSMRLAQNTLTATEQRRKAGLISETDVLQARQNKAQKVSDFEAALGNQNTAQATLAQSLGLPANVTVNAVPPEREINLSVLDHQVNQLVDDALTQRPDIAAASATVLSKQATARQANANVWPTLSTSVNAQRTFYDGSFKSQGASVSSSGHYDDASALVAFNVDLFDGLNKVNKARAARSDAEAAMAGLATAELNAIAEVVTSYITVQTAKNRVTATAVLVEASQKSFESVQASYKAGLKNILDLLTAQDNLSSAKAQNIQARNDLFLNSVKLSRATGSLTPSLSKTIAEPRASTR